MDLSQTERSQVKLKPMDFLFVRFWPTLLFFLSKNECKTLHFTSCRIQALEVLEASLEFLAAVSFIKTRIFSVEAFFLHTLKAKGTQGNPQNRQIQGAKL